MLWGDNTWLHILHARMKDIEIDFQVIRDMVQAKELVIQYVPSEDQLTYIYIYIDETFIYC